MLSDPPASAPIQLTVDGSPGHRRTGRGAGTRPVYNPGIGRLQCQMNGAGICFLGVEENSASGKIRRRSGRLVSAGPGPALRSRLGHRPRAFSTRQGYVRKVRGLRVPRSYLSFFSSTFDRFISIIHCPSIAKNNSVPSQKCGWRWRARAEGKARILVRPILSDVVGDEAQLRWPGLGVGEIEPSQGIFAISRPAVQCAPRGPAVNLKPDPYCLLLFPAWIYAFVARPGGPTALCLLDTCRPMCCFVANFFSKGAIAGGWPGPPFYLRLGVPRLPSLRSPTAIGAHIAGFHNSAMRAV